MKRIIYLIVSALLIALSILFVNGDERLIADSEKAVEQYGGIYTDKDGNIISLYPYHGKEAFLKNMASVTKLGEDTDLPVYLAIPPRKMDVLEIPADIDTKPSAALFDTAKKESQKAGITYVDLKEAMTGENLYFATDHHWTSHGAYLAYCSIILAMGENPYSEDEFEIKTAHTAYRGSDYNKSDRTSSKKDSIELYYSSDYDQYVATIVNYPYDSDENNVVIGGMYHMESLDSHDPYTVYFKGNTPYVTIRNGKDRPTLMIVRDSFASALAPFLALHYDIVMIDPRFYPEKLSKAVERERVSMILILENMGSFTENTIKFTY